MSGSMKVVFAFGIVFGLLESVMVFLIEFPAQAAVFAAVFFACAWAIYSRHSALAAAVIGLFLLAEVAGLPFYSRSSLVDWVVQFGVGLPISALGLLAVVRVLLQRRRERALA